MRRYQLVIGGTAAGLAGVLAFQPGSHHLAPTAAGTGPGATNGSGPTSTPAATEPSSGAASSSTTSGAQAAPATRSATSARETYPYGDLAVTVTVEGHKISRISITTLQETDGRSVAIDHYALPQLEQQVIRADSTDVDGVSGATFTSQAFVDAVANALGKLGIRA